MLFIQCTICIQNIPNILQRIFFIFFSKSYRSSNKWNSLSAQPFNVLFPIYLMSNCINWCSCDFHPCSIRCSTSSGANEMSHRVVVHYWTTTRPRASHYRQVFTKFFTYMKRTIYLYTCIIIYCMKFEHMYFLCTGLCARAFKSNKTAYINICVWHCWCPFCEHLSLLRDKSAKLGSHLRLRGHLLCSTYAL